MPDSCCKTPTILCGRRDHPSNIQYTVNDNSETITILTKHWHFDVSFLQGCIYKFLETTKDHLIILGAVGLGLSVLELFGIVLGSCLYIKLRHDFDDWQWHFSQIQLWRLREITKKMKKDIKKENKNTYTQSEINRHFAFKLFEIIDLNQSIFDHLSFLLKFISNFTWNLKKRFRTTNMIAQ